MEDFGDGKEGRVWLTDYGLATEEVRSKEFRMGTPSCFSPENECKKNSWQAPFDVKDYSTQKRLRRTMSGGWEF